MTVAFNRHFEEDSLKSEQNFFGQLLLLLVVLRLLVVASSSLLSDDDREVLHQTCTICGRVRLKVTSCQDVTWIDRR